MKMIPMHRIIASELIVLDTMFLLLLPVQAQETQSGEETPMCSAALQAAQNKIKQGRDVTFMGVEKLDVSRIYEDYPKDRPSSYLLGLSGSAAESVMQSPKFLNAISADIIKNCHSVSMIDFNLYETDWTLTFGHMGGGKVKEFTQCVDDNANGQLPSKLAWGYIFCL